MTNSDNDYEELKKYVADIVTNLKCKIKDSSNYHKGENKTPQRRPTISEVVGE